MSDKKNVSGSTPTGGNQIPVKRDPKTGKILNIDELAFSMAKANQAAASARGDFSIPWETFLTGAKEYVAANVDTQSSAEQYLQQAKQEQFKQSYQQQMTDFETFKKNKEMEIKDLQAKSSSLTSAQNNTILLDDLLSNSQAKIKSSYAKLGLTGAALSATAISNVLAQASVASDNVIKSRLAQAAQIDAAVASAKADISATGDALMSMTDMATLDSEKIKKGMEQADAKIKQANDQRAAAAELADKMESWNKIGAIGGAIGGGIGFYQGISDQRAYANKAGSFDYNLDTEGTMSQRADQTKDYFKRSW